MCYVENCGCCHEHEQRLDDAREFYESVVEMLYKDECLNVEKLQDHLEELGWYLRISKPFKDYNHLPNVRREEFHEHRYTA